jgi:hypothetical protein
MSRVVAARPCVACSVFVGVLRAGVSLGLTGRYALQSAQVRAGLDLWAADQPVELVIIDDRGSPSRAMAAYRVLLADGIEILLGPYGSGTVRHVAPVVCGSGRLLWNHGGAADDLASPLLATVVAPASTYLASLLVLARDAGLDNVLVARGSGRFAQHVATGGRRAAENLGLRARQIAAGDMSALLEGAGLAPVDIPRRGGTGGRGDVRGGRGRRTTGPGGTRGGRALGLCGRRHRRVRSPTGPVGRRGPGADPVVVPLPPCRRGTVRPGVRPPFRGPPRPRARLPGRPGGGRGLPSRRGRCPGLRSRPSPGVASRHLVGSISPGQLLEAGRLCPGCRPLVPR